MIIEKITKYRGLSEIRYLTENAETGEQITDSNGFFGQKIRQKITIPEANVMGVWYRVGKISFIVSLSEALEYRSMYKKNF